MGCFCRNLVPDETATSERPEQTDEAAEETLQPTPVVAAVADWLAARWLPAPRWEPDPEWHDTDWPEAPMDPASMGVLTALMVARQSCQTAFGIDPADPEQCGKLARIIGTLNRRNGLLEKMEEDRRPWEALSAWQSQVEAVERAVSERVLEEEPEETKVAPWRAVLGKVKALAPLVAVGRLQRLDFRRPEAVDELSKTVADLRRVEVPPLDDPSLILRLISRVNAVSQLKQAFGVDPRSYPFERVASAVQRKADALAKALPKRVALRDGVLDGMPARQPNPGQILNRDTVAAARRLTPDVLRRLRWRVPPYETFPLLTTAAPVAALTQAMSRIGPNPVRQSPCGNTCDAATAMRAWSERPRPVSS